MHPEFIQNLRYKLQRRVARLNSLDHQKFHFGLQQFWGFLKNHPIFFGILDELSARWLAATNSANDIVEKEQTLAFDDEIECAAVASKVLELCVARHGEQGQEIEFRIGQMYDSSSKDLDEALDTFRTLFLEPFYEYLDEQLDDQRAMLGMLLRFKHKCEWFTRDVLYKLWEGNTQSGERLLAARMYEYLHDQGLNFWIEPQSASGEIDLIAAQGDDDPLLADAKIFDPSRDKGKSYIAKAFAQVYRYTLDFNEPCGYIVIFQTSEHELRFALANATRSVPYVIHNGKVIFLLNIDIYPHTKSASKRGALKPVEISELDLIQSANEGMESNPEQ